MNNDGYYLDFMYDKISVPTMCMVYWLQIPEFVEKIKEKIDKNISITDKVVYGIVKDIYFPKKQLKDSGQDTGEFNHYRTRTGLKKLSEAIFGDRNYWQKEYVEYTQLHHK